MAKQKNGIHVVTVVWGYRYVDMMIKTTLPSLLGEGNINVLSNTVGAKYCIYTTKEDRDILSKNKIFTKLKDKITVEFLCFDINSGGEKYKQATSLHNNAIRNAFESQASIIFITPDAVWSAGTIKQILKISDLGYNAILIDGPRVEARKFMDHWISRFKFNENGGKTISPRTLAKLVLKTPHPYESSTTAGVTWLHDVPFTLHWPVAGEGAISASFCKFPIFFRPNAPTYEFHGAIDHGLINAAITDPETIYYSIDTDEFSVASITNIGVSSINLKPISSNHRLLKIAQWAYREANPQNMCSIFQLSRRHGKKITKEKWLHHEKVANNEIRQIVAICRIMKLVKYLQKYGASQLAAVIAYTLYEGDISDYLKNLSSKTFMIPIDSSWETADYKASDLIINDSNSIKLIKWLNSHSINGIHSSTTIKKQLKGANLINTDIRVGEDILHLIDKPLSPLPVTGNK